MHFIRLAIYSYLAQVICLAALAVAPAYARQINPVPGSANATVTLDGKPLPPPPMPFSGVIVDNAKKLFHGNQGRDILGTDCHRAHDCNLRAPK